MDVKISSSDDEMNKSKEKSESSEISENSKNSKDNEQIINYFPLINKNLSNLEENRQNYLKRILPNTAGPIRSRALTLPLLVLK